MIQTAVEDKTDGKVSDDKIEQSFEEFMYLDHPLIIKDQATCIVLNFS